MTTKRKPQSTQARNREYRPKPHPRQREIDEHPRPISMSGVGHGLSLGGSEGK